MTLIARHTQLVFALGWLLGSTGTPSLVHAESREVPKLDALDLPTAIALALQSNPELKVTKSDEEAASAQTDRASAGRWPTLKAQAGLTEYRRNQRLYPAAVPGEPAVITHHMLGGDVLLSIPIYTGGRVSGNIDSAKQTEESARLASRWTKVDVVFRVHGAVLFDSCPASVDSRALVVRGWDDTKH
jgi:outer membrane protein TolC